MRGRKKTLTPGTEHQAWNISITQHSRPTSRLLLSSQTFDTRQVEKRKITELALKAQDGDGDNNNNSDEV